ncbi:hypothetical protein HYH03_011384 [Edaphochlamys debaryana]|uniref:Uncharacterized protein n=1 Tax=Edaphochlamys debaryana TaxID=47281 RepID=A0A835XUZ2_9CHLO|nr:hypothetical protein HYH03_011384 [Edaphochlamys debaryana]|eukprot:KAG2490260.1 hypothetical protein HYH03_011384 [Edaphochlamys debaryana]
MRRRWRSCSPRSPRPRRRSSSFTRRRCGRAGEMERAPSTSRGSLVTEEWRRRLISTVAAMLSKATPLPPSPPALSVLRFVRAMLRAQPFHALGRQLAAAAAAFGAGRSSGGSSGGGMVSAEASLASKILCGSSATVHTVCTLLGLLCCREVAPGLTVEAAAERAACVEEFARGLAESGFLEHSTRLTLMLQARYPQELQKESKLFYIQTLWRAQERASGSAPLMWAPPSPGDGASGAAARSVSPAAAAHLRSALSGRCVQTAVRVYGVGTLRVADRGTSYGLPAELQTAGLTLLETEEGGARALDPIALELLLRQLASGSALPSPGPGASLELALRASTVEAVRLAAGALACGRLLLPRQRPSPRLEAQRAEWWRLAVWVSAISAHEPEDYLQRVGGLVVEPLLAVWPDGRLDLDALPPVAPPEVAAALACGLLSSLCTMFNCPSSRNPPALFAACDEARPDGPGFALFLAPLLAYGDTGSCQLALVTLGMMTARGTGTGLFAHMGGSEGDAEQRRSDTGPYRRASEGFFRAASEAMCRCRGLAGADAATAAWGSGGAAAAGPAPSAAAGQPAATGAGNSAAAAGSGAAAEAPPPHLLQFKQMYDFAQAWRQEVSAPGPPAGAGSALATVTAFAAAFRATSAAPIGSNSSSTASAEEVRRGESGRGVGLGLGARPGNAAAKGADATAEGAGSAAATAAGAASVQAGAGRSAASSAGAAASPSAEGSGSAAATASPSASPAAADPAAAAAPPERWGWFRALRWLAAGGLTTAAGMLGGKRGSGQG